MNRQTGADADFCIALAAVAMLDLHHARAVGVMDRGQFVRARKALRLAHRRELKKRLTPAIKRQALHSIAATRQKIDNAVLERETGGSHH